MRSLIKLIASLCYLGYIPLAPGTAASAAALGLYLLVKGNIFHYTTLLVTITAVGFLVAARAEKIYQEKDAPQIVIDEVAGILLAFWGLRLDWALLITGFFIFRALDAVKAYPANRLEKLGGSTGIMADDLMAGLYTNLVLQVVTRVFVRI